MFSKKCPRCNRKIGKDFEYCPFCGMRFYKDASKERRDFGLLGRRDDEELDLGMRLPLGFNKIFNSLLNQVDKQFKQLDKEMGKEKLDESKMPKVFRQGISISFKSESGKQPKIEIREFGKPGKMRIEKIGKGFELNEERARKEGRRIKKKAGRELSDEESARLAKLPRKEAIAKVRRLSDKVIYELELPGVKNLKDVFITKLENSIEVKAFSKDKAYFKLIPLKLPILDYSLKKEKLTLELGA